MFILYTCVCVYVLNYYIYVLCTQNVDTDLKRKKPAMLESLKEGKQLLDQYNTLMQNTGSQSDAPEQRTHLMRNIAQLQEMITAVSTHALKLLMNTPMRTWALKDMGTSLI